MLKVVVFSLGGTIAMTSDSGGGASVALSGEQLVAAVPGLADLDVQVEVRDLRRISSASLGFADVLDLAQEIRDSAADGVVVIQGTDTLEETAYLLDLLHEDDRPLVVTGAMRNPSLAGPDGPANVLAAITVAADPHVRGLGCLVVFADEIHAASRVGKTHSTSPGTFASPNGGVIGYVVEGRPRVFSSPRERVVVRLAPDAAMPAVALVTATFGDTGEMLDGLADRYGGLVLASLGAGHVPETYLRPLTALAARIPVILASRTGAGAILESTYGFPGSETDLLARGLISAGFLHPFKARILLAVLLAAKTSSREIIATFAQAGST